MTAALFLAFVGIVTLAVSTGIWRHAARRTRGLWVAGLATWLVVVGALASFGVLRNAALRPPGAVYIFVPVLLFIVFFAVRSQAALRLALAAPVGWLMTAQVFRVGVELFLHRLWVDGLVPRMLTYEGGNLDILVGATAPIAGWLAGRGRTGARLALAWNAVGLAALANVVARAVMTSPGPLNVFLHAEVPNLAIGIFPYSYIAGFLAPLAVCLHVLAIRALRHGLAPPRITPSPASAGDSANRASAATGGAPAHRRTPAAAAAAAAAAATAGPGTAARET